MMLGAISMIQSMSKKLLLTAVIVSAAGFVVGQESSEKKRSRLPNYYAEIVTELQRVQIYKIQENYSKKIAAVQEQLAALEKQRDEEIEGVLDAQQKQRLKLAQDGAAAKRAKAAAEKKAAQAKAAADKK
jgi:hypothetical protein